MQVLELLNVQVIDVSYYHRNVRYCHVVLSQSFPNGQLISAHYVYAGCLCIVATNMLSSLRVLRLSFLPSCWRLARVELVGEKLGFTKISTGTTTTSIISKEAPQSKKLQSMESHLKEISSSFSC